MTKLLNIAKDMDMIKEYTAKGDAYKQEMTHLNHHNTYPFINCLIFVN